MGRFRNGSREELDGIASLLNAQWSAPRSRTGRRWKISTVSNGVARLYPLAGDGMVDPMFLVAGGGVVGIRRPIGVLTRDWTRYDGPTRWGHGG